MCAPRGGITTGPNPQENEGYLVEITKNTKDKLDIKPVRWIDEGLEVALKHVPEPLEGKVEADVGKAGKGTGKNKPVHHH